MLFDLLVELMSAGTDKEKEKAYKRLERVGVDRTTANCLVKEISRKSE